MASWFSSNDSDASSRSKADHAIRPATFACIVLYFCLRWMHNFTELTPTHENVDAVCVVIAILIGIAASIAEVYFSRESTSATFFSAFLVLLLGAFAGYMLSTQAAGIVEGWIDFPPSRTTSSTAMLPITHAYRSDGKGGPSWHIETEPGVELAISQSDYNFITSSRTDTGDEACVKVTLEQAGKAIRVMHSFFGTLPAGSVYRCPANLTPIP